MSSKGNRSSSTIERDIERKERFDLLRELENLKEIDWETVEIDENYQELLNDLNNLSELYSDDEKIQNLILEIQSALPDFS